MKKFDEIKEMVAGFKQQDEKSSIAQLDTDPAEDCSCEPESPEGKLNILDGSRFSFFILISILGMIGLCVFGSKSDDKVLSDRISQLETVVSSLQSDCEALQAEMVEPDEDAKAAYLYDRESKKAIDENSVYYGLTYEDLWDDESFDDEVLALLEGIAKIHYGTAGSSLQLMGRGANFVSIAKRGEDAWRNISAHLDTMTPAELDFLSFRLLDSYYYALDIVRGGSVVGQLEDIGFSPKLYEGCTEVHLARFLGYMIELFDEKGVNYEWETYNIMSLFR